MKVLITGGNGFIGKNLQLHLAERKNLEVLCFGRNDNIAQLIGLLKDVDFVFHLAGVNRPREEGEFTTGNLNLTEALCQAIGAVFKESSKKPIVVYTSSIQAGLDNPYGESKRGAERALFSLAHNHQVSVHVFRLPNVFGKWCKPNYNSAVATFCHNIARSIPIQVNDPAAPITLLYVDDLIARFLQVMDCSNIEADTEGFATVAPYYTTTVGELVQSIQAFRESRNTLMTERVGAGLLRALYSTYLSYLPPEMFAYAVPQYQDPRGVFAEMLKTPDSGQFSYFTAHPGITRGGHYHHSKTEKFLVIKGRALFKFRQMQTGQIHELVTTGDNPEIVETVPGWTHDITNVGSDEMIVMLWANEVFDRARPDTFACPL